MARNQPLSQRAQTSTAQPTSCSTASSAPARVLQRLGVLGLEHEVGQKRPAPDRQARPEEQLERVARRSPEGAERVHAAIIDKAKGAASGPAEEGPVHSSAGWEAGTGSGCCAGLGASLGVLCTGLLPRPIAAVAAAGIAAGIGIAVFGWDEAVGGVAGGVSGGLAAIPVVRGALRRGGTRGGLALLVAAGALGVAAVAFVPALGYLQAVAAARVGPAPAREGAGALRGAAHPRA